MEQLPPTTSDKDRQELHHKCIQLFVLHQMLTVGPRLGDVGFVAMEALMSF